MITWIGLTCVKSRPFYLSFLTATAVSGCRKMLHSKISRSTAHGGSTPRLLLLLDKSFVEFVVQHLHCV